MDHTQRQRQREVPIPHRISVHITFLDPDLGMEEFEREVRRVVREQMDGEVPSWMMPEEEPQMMEEYDDWLRRIMMEELLRN